MHSAEKARDTTLDDEKYDVRCSEGAWDMTSVLATALCKQPSVTTSHVTCEYVEKLVVIHVCLKLGSPTG